MHQIPSHAITDPKSACVFTCCKRAYLTESKQEIYTRPGETTTRPPEPEKHDKIREPLLRQTTAEERAETASSVSDMVLFKTPKQEIDDTGTDGQTGALTPPNQPDENHSLVDQREFQNLDHYNEHGQEMFKCKFCFGLNIVGTTHCLSLIHI